MHKVFLDFDFLKRLALVIGINKTIKIINRNLYLQKDRLTTDDVASIYDKEYAVLIDQHQVVKKVNGYNINYYTQFIFDYLAEKRNDEKKVILDFGCGCGDLSLALASLGYAVYGVDFNSQAITLAAKRATKSQMENIKFECVNFLETQGQYDYIILSDVVEHISKKELDEIFKKSLALLKNKGQLLIHTPNGKFRPGNPDNWFMLVFARFMVKLQEFLRLITGKKLTQRDLLMAYYSQTHINIMTPRQLEKILTKVGFHQVTFKYRSKRSKFLFKLLEKIGFSSDMGVIASKN